jgi:hypothetical protein
MFLRPYALDTQQSRDVGSIDVSPPGPYHRQSRFESSPEDADFYPRWTVLYTGPSSIAPESSWRYTGAIGQWITVQCERARWLYTVFLRLRTSITEVTETPSTVATSIIHEEMLYGMR